MKIGLPWPWRKLKWPGGIALDVFVPQLFLFCIFCNLLFYGIKAAANYDIIGINLTVFGALNQLVSTPKPELQRKTKISTCFGKPWNICQTLLKVCRLSDKVHVISIHN